ncbi:MAG: pyrroloquinoline quinone biosynthesis peptide chaperone PqqD [Mangrovicoccus sp.]|nr:pyrroloquinoline quinone biosynthesis peptide chaperone PqqD [Mangrovicoccus sp.]
MSPIPADSIPYLPRGVRLHRDHVRARWVLLAPERTIALDEIGHAILSELDGARPFADVVARLAAKFDAPAPQIADDVSGFLGTLRARRFLELA